jgi:hypothetical protein
MYVCMYGYTSTGTGTGRYRTYRHIAERCSAVYIVLLPATCYLAEERPPQALFLCTRRISAVPFCCSLPFVKPSTGPNPSRDNHSLTCGIDQPAPTFRRCNLSCLIFPSLTPTTPVEFPHTLNPQPSSSLPLSPVVPLLLLPLPLPLSLPPSVCATPEQGCLLSVQATVNAAFLPRPTPNRKTRESRAATRIAGTQPTVRSAGATESLV